MLGVVVVRHSVEMMAFFFFMMDGGRSHEPAKPSQQGTNASREDVKSQDGASASTSANRSPAISLPKGGGGAMRGIGEKFAANPVTGTGFVTVPVTVSPDRAGFDLQGQHPHHLREGP